ncbi:MAG: 4-(cytidine 5'-diphospho)-2-C-methyl-D-erythritol kinase [Actinobacteria bacterium]|nr:4-(cytidine 5'-diphospho)-2-C-methyl-D-erythritol kinase [Actinomycetota bacterium]
MSGAGAILAPAKLTLSLRILGLRDDGFHALEALTVSVSEPADTLVVAEADPGTVALAVSGVTADLPVDDTNLVVRAVRAVLPDGLGLRIALHKVIPPGAGLGGGSSDAGAVLRTLRDRFGVDPERVAQAGAALGSDIPFCVSGTPAWMRGRGEVLDPVALRGALAVVVVKPPFALHTPPVYRTWDELGGPAGERVLPAPAAVAHLTASLVNDLEPAAEHVEPRLRPFRSALEAAAGRPALLAGSGSACWVAFDHAEEAEVAAARVREALGLPAWVGTALG